MMLKRFVVVSGRLVRDWLQRPALMLVIALAMTGCGGTPTDGDSTSPVAEPPRLQAADPPCHRPIESACRAKGCPTYEEAVLEAKGMAPQLWPDCHADGGTCGGLRYVRLADGFVSETKYFDAAGTMVAAVQTSDAIDQKCQGLFTYGRLVRCERLHVEGYCREPLPR